MYNVLYVFCVTVMSQLTFTLRDPVVMAGDSIFLICSGTDPNVRYNDEDIYISGKLLKKFIQKGFVVVGNQTPNEVIISKGNVKVDDAGEYECRDRDGNYKSAQLTVFGKVACMQ